MFKCSIGEFNSVHIAFALSTSRCSVKRRRETGRRWRWRRRSSCTGPLSVRRSWRRKRTHTSNSATRAKLCSSSVLECGSTSGWSKLVSGDRIIKIIPCAQLVTTRWPYQASLALKGICQMTNLGFIRVSNNSLQCQINLFDCQLNLFQSMTICRRLSPTRSWWGNRSSSWSTRGLTRWRASRRATTTRRTIGNITWRRRSRGLGYESKLTTPIFALPSVWELQSRKWTHSHCGWWLPSSPLR